MRLGAALLSSACQISSIFCWIKSWLEQLIIGIVTGTSWIGACTLRGCALEPVVGSRA
jgi:hypothetical protein